MQDPDLCIYTIKVPLYLYLVYFIFQFENYVVFLQLQIPFPFLFKSFQDNGRHISRESVSSGI